MCKCPPPSPLHSQRQDNNSSSPSMDPFYELYKDAGHVPIEICVNGILSLICFGGICLNWSLVYVTIKSKSLRSPCNILIAIYAFSASFMLIGYTIKFFVFLFGINYISLRICYSLLFFPAIGTFSATLLQLLIGIERLVAIAWPIWYQQRGKQLLYKILMAFCCVNVLIDTYVFYSAASQHWNKLVMCFYTDFTNLPEDATFTYINAVIIYVGEFICYALIWMVIWCRNSTTSETNRRLARSLSIIMAVSLFFFILRLIFVKWIMPTLNLDMFAVEYVITPVANAILCIAHSGITIILLLCSKEYLSAFRTIFGIGHNQTRVAPIVTSNNR